MDHPNRERMDALFRADPYARGLGCELVTWDPGTATVRFVPIERHHNFGGTTHGGVVFGLGDVAFSIASNSWGRRAVALTVDTHFLAAAHIGTALTAVATERARSRRTASYQIEVADDAGRAVASLHAMVYRLRDWHLGEEAWPAAWRERY